MYQLLPRGAILQLVHEWVQRAEVLWALFTRWRKYSTSHYSKFYSKFLINNLNKMKPTKPSRCWRPIWMSHGRTEWQLLPRNLGLLHLATLLVGKIVHLGIPATNPQINILSDLYIITYLRWYLQECTHEYKYMQKYMDVHMWVKDVAQWITIWMHKSSQYISYLCITVLDDCMLMMTVNKR